MIAAHELVQLCDDLFAIDALLHVEVEAAALRTDRPPGDAVAKHGAEEMQTGVHPHVGVTAYPVEVDLDDLADLRQSCIRGDQVQDALAFAVTGVEDGKQRAVGAAELSGIARLPAAHWIED